MKLKMPLELNEFMSAMLENSKGYMDLDMWTEAIDDALIASELGVSSEKEYVAFFYIDHLVEDICKDVWGDKLSDNDEDQLKRFMYQRRNEFDYTDIEAFKIAALSWMDSKKVKKEAYPNTNRGKTKPKHNDTIRWAELAQLVRRQYLKTGNEKEALLTFSKRLEAPENLEFLAWYQFKFGKDAALYDLNKEISQKSEVSMQIKFALYDENNRYHVPLLNKPEMISDDEIKPFQSEKFIRTKDDRQRMQEGKAKLVGRTLAIDKMLQQYIDLMSQEDFGAVEDALNLLRKRIRSLKTSSIVVDSVVKTANQVGKRGFAIGKVKLLECAEEFSGMPHTTLIKEALNTANIENLGNLIIDLQRIDGELKKREMVRAIARVDFALHDMRLSALFPELSDAQGRLIDAYTYASNKMEAVIPKMRSTQANPPGENTPPTPSLPYGKPTDIPVPSELGGEKLTGLMGEESVTAPQPKLTKELKKEVRPQGIM